MKVFSSFKDVKVIKLSSVEDAFTGFANKVRPFCFSPFKVLHFELAPNINAINVTYHVHMHSILYFKGKGR